MPDGLSVRVRLPLDRFELDVSFETEAKVTGIFGVSGSGKSSLLESIAGIRRQARGRIRLGEDVWLDSDHSRFEPPERRGIGFVPQDGLLFPHLNVEKNLLSGSRRTHRDSSLRELLDSVCDLLELTPLRHRHVDTLSGGERQRVALGRALCSNPRLLILDEPLASLDIGLRRKLLPFLRKVREQHDIPMLLVSHDPIEVQALCDDLIAMKEGRIIKRGLPREVLTDPTVFAISEEEGFQNVLPARLVHQDEDSSTVRLETTSRDVDIITRKAEGAVGQALLLGIPAHEIIIASCEPRGLSARNTLPATIDSVRAFEDLYLIDCSLAEGVPPLTIEITEKTRRNLGIEEGLKVFVVFKATSCTLFEARKGNARKN